MRFPARALFVSLVLACAACAQSRQVDGIFREWDKPDTPGAAVAVVRDGKIVLAKGYGIANLEYGIPISPDTVFHVASVSKQFTAMALVLLEQDGKLSLEDDIRKFLTELPDYGHKISIRNLLQHTSGIRDQWQTLALAGWRLDDVITQQQILRMLFRQNELNFTPGSEHLYSNGGYTLAAEIVARAGGKPLPEFCDERIFRPLGMTNTHFHIDHKKIVRNRAYSYSRTKQGYEASPLNYANVGATSLFTTAPDLVKWLDNFREPKVGGRKAIDRLEERAVLTSGRKIDYALGLSIGTYRGLKTVSHGGADAGYRSYAAWFPEVRMGVAVLSNLGNFNTGQAAQKVAAVFAGDRMAAEPPKPAERKFVEVDPKAIERLAGVYRLGSLVFETAAEGGKLVAAPPGQPKTELKALSPSRFYVAQFNSEIEFTPTSGGGMAVKLFLPGEAMEGERLTAPFDPKDLPSYAGAYWSEELETQYTIRVNEGRVVADHVRHGEIALRPVARDQFQGGSWFFQDVRFQRDASGRVTGMQVGGGRVRAVRFERR